jgi:aspartate kinase
VPEARKIPIISYEEMLEMAATGAKVLQLRSVEYAKNTGVLIHVRSSFTDSEGTYIKEAGLAMERPIISGVTYDETEGKITIFGVPDRPGIAACVFQALAEKNINVDMIVQNVSWEGLTDISFTLSLDDLPNAEPVIKKVVAKIGARGYNCDRNIAKVSLIGAGMRSHPGVAASMFRVLADNNINIQMISTSPIKIACVIDKKSVATAVKALHKHFSLDKQKSFTK